MTSYSRSRRIDKSTDNVNGLTQRTTREEKKNQKSEHEPNVLIRFDANKFVRFSQQNGTFCRSEWPDMI